MQQSWTQNFKNRSADILGKTSEEFLRTEDRGFWRKLKPRRDERRRDINGCEFEVGNEEDDNIEMVSANMSFLPLENQDLMEEWSG